MKQVFVIKRCVLYSFNIEMVKCTKSIPYL